MITNSQISDFAKRRTEFTERLSGRELTGQEKSQCRAFFNNFGHEFRRHREKGREFDSNKFTELNAPEVVKMTMNKELETA